MTNIFKSSFVRFLVTIEVAYAALAVYYGFLLTDIVKYQLFLFICVLAPGFWFSTKLLSNFNLDTVDKFILGIPVSLSLICIIAYVKQWLGFDWLPFLYVPFIVFGFYEILKSWRGHAFFENRHDDWLIISFFYLLAILLFFNLFTMTFPLPLAGRTTAYYQDSLWNLGNTWSVIRGLPLTDARFMDMRLGYHIGQNLFHYAAFYFTGIDPFFTQFYLDPIFQWFILIYSVYRGAIIFAGFNRWTAILLLFITFFTSLPGFLVGGALGHVFYNPITLFFGLPYFFLIAFWANTVPEGFSGRKLLYFASLLCLVGSSKVHLNVLIPLAYTGVLLLAHIRGKVSLKTLMLSELAMATIVLVLKFTIYAAAGEEISLGLGDNMSANLERILFVATPLMTAPFSLMVFIIVIFKRKFLTEFFRNQISLYILLFFLSAVGLHTLIDLGPGGTVYNIWYPYFLLCIIYATVASKFVAKPQIQASRWSNFSNIAMSAVCLSFLIYGFYQFYDNPVKHWRSSTYFRHIHYETRMWDEAASLNFDEWNGLQWLKHNTDKSETFFSDRRSYKHEVSGILYGRFFAYSAISGRQAYAEGDDYVFGSNSLVAKARWEKILRFLNAKDADDALFALKDIGDVGYFIQSRRFNKHSFGNYTFLKEVYSNNSMGIYKIMLPKKIGTQTLGHRPVI